jgi:hypothetical protein
MMLLFGGERASKRAGGGASEAGKKTKALLLMLLFGGEVGKREGWRGRERSEQVETGLGGARRTNDLVRSCSRARVLASLACSL